MDFFCNTVVLGSAIAEDPSFQFADTLHPRDILAQMVDFQDHDSLRTGILYGVRRTGKSVLLRQWLLNLPYEERQRAAYLTIENESFVDIKKDLNLLRSNNYKYVVLDEVTACKDFTGCSASLADNYCSSGMKIFIAGTDTLSLWLAMTEGLFDRNYTLHTTHIPFAEWKRLIGTGSLDDYIRWGGLLHLEPTEGELHHSSPLLWTADGMRQYFTSAISNNILNSIRNYKDGQDAGLLGCLLQRNAMDSAVYGLFGSLTRREFINYMDGISDIDEKFLLSALKSLVLVESHTFDEKNMFRQFKLPDVSRTASAFANKDDKLYEVMNHISKILLNSAESLLEVKDYIGRYVSAAQFLDIVSYLRHLEVFAMRPSMAFPPLGASIAELERYNAINRELHTQNLVSQPGLRYAQADCMKKLILDDAVFASLAKSDQEKILQTFENGVYGLMQEDIVLYETMQQCKQFGKVTLGDTSWLTYRSLPIKGYKAEFPRSSDDFRNKEIDLVIEDTRQGSSYHLLEIKHSAKMSPNQSQWLRDSDVLARIQRKNGTIQSKTVLYNGDSGNDGEIQYINIEEYLTTLHTHGIAETLTWLSQP